MILVFVKGVMVGIFDVRLDSSINWLGSCYIVGDCMSWFRVF